MSTKMRTKSNKSLTILIAILMVISNTIACSLPSRLFERVSSPSSRADISDLIVFVGTDGNIYTIDREGRKQKAITQDADPDPAPGETGRVYQYPTWAPDGDQLVFVEYDNLGQDDLRARLLKVRMGEGAPVDIFTSDLYFPFYLFWSPDSQQISFLSNGSAAGELALHLAAADGSKNNLVETGQPFYWDWSPEENVIFIHTGGTAADNIAARLAFLAMDEPFQNQEVDLRPSAFQAPAWSPSGEVIALAVETNDGDALVLRERNSGEYQSIAAINGPAAFAWAPDGRHLAYTSPSQDRPNQDLYAIQPKRPDEKRLLTTAFIAAFFWSPDSSQLAIFKPTISDRGEDISDRGQQSAQVYLSLEVINVDTGDSRHLVTFAPSDSFLNLLPFFDQYQRSIRLWSPDSQKLVVSTIDEQGQPGIYVVDVLEGTSTRIASGDLAFWSWK